jgi:hypothetical protein
MNCSPPGSPPLELPSLVQIPIQPSEHHLLCLRLVLHPGHVLAVETRSARLGRHSEDGYFREGLLEVV